MKLKHFIISGLVIIVIASTVAFTQKEQGTYEYISLVQSYTFIYKSVPGGTWEDIKVDKTEVGNNSDFRVILKLVSEYETKGWEVVTNNVYTIPSSNAPNNYFLLRKSK